MNSLQKSEELGDTGFSPEACISLALISLDRKDLDLAAKYINRGLEIVKSDDYWSSVRVYYTLGEVLLAQSHFKEAGEWIEKAYNSATKKGGKLTKAYAQYSFSRYLYIAEKDEAALSIINMCKQNLSDIGSRLMFDKAENLESGILSAMQEKNTERKKFPRGN